MNHQTNRDTYTIPPNFVDTGTFFGGMFRARNAIEAGILAASVGLPVFLYLPAGLTGRIIALCLTALPLALVALIGISGESLSSFLFQFLKYLKNRRVIGEEIQDNALNPKPSRKSAPNHQSPQKAAQKPSPKQFLRQHAKGDDFPAEFDEVRFYEIKQKLRPSKKQQAKVAEKKPTIKNAAKRDAKKSNRTQKKKGHGKLSKSTLTDSKKPLRAPQAPSFLNPVAGYLPIMKVENGVIYTKDHRFVKVVEVIPINFLLRSAQEQRSIIYSFISYLKISPVKLQFKVLTRRADIGRHLDTVRREMAVETNEHCRLMQEDYLSFVQQIGSREAVTRRFFLIFEYEHGSRHTEDEGEAVEPCKALLTPHPPICGNAGMKPSSLKMRMKLPWISSTTFFAGMKALKNLCLTK